MAAGSLARRYARAVLSLEAVDKVAADLRSLAKAMKDSDELVSTLASPAIRRADRRRVLDGLLERVGSHANTKNLVYLLLDGERMSALPAISRELDAMLEARGGRISATITSAKPLEQAQVSQITAALEKISGKKVEVTRREDPALLGGVVAKLGDTVYDGSLRTQLRALREELTK